MKVYCYAKCSTCQKALAWLQLRGKAFETIDIKGDHPDKETLRALWQKSGLPLKRFFNTSGMLYRELDLSSRLPSMSEEEQLTLLASDGMLVKRPLLITETNVLPGFREKDWAEALEEPHA